MATVQDFLKNDKWVKRMDAAFSSTDVNKNGYISEEDWLIVVDNLEKRIPDRPDEIANLRKCVAEYLTAFGLTKGVQADKEKYRELSAAFCIAEAERTKRGEKTMTETYFKAAFQVVDTDRSGYVTFDEFKVLMDASKLGEEQAKATFNMLDKNKNGRIEQNEFISSNLKFWSTLDNHETKGMFGDKFE